MNKAMFRKWSILTTLLQETKKIAHTLEIIIPDLSIQLSQKMELYQKDKEVLQTELVDPDRIQKITDKIHRGRGQGHQYLQI